MDILNLIFKAHKLVWNYQRVKAVPDAIKAGDPLEAAGSGLSVIGSLAHNRFMHNTNTETKELQSLIEPDPSLSAESKETRDARLDAILSKMTTDLGQMTEMQTLSALHNTTGSLQFAEHVIQQPKGLVDLALLPMHLSSVKEHLQEQLQDDLSGLGTLNSGSRLLSQVLKETKREK